MIKVLTGLLFAAGLLFVGACSTSRPLPEPYYSVPVERSTISSEERSWWTYRFRIFWPEEEMSPDFAIDLLLAHELIKPVLEKNSGKILWWRFHRRAGRDGSGHQFSFIFYTDNNSAAKIVNFLDSSSLLAELKESALIIKTIASNSKKEDNAAVDAYSDKSWSPAIQKTWPSYIMGVSAFWLALIDEVKSEQLNAQRGSSKNAVAVKALLEQYREVDDEIAELWRSEGEHALLHHLSAVFGYKPMLIKNEVICSNIFEPCESTF